jgi:hypothetical protein
MALIDELKEKRTNVSARMSEDIKVRDEAWERFSARVAGWEVDIADLDRAIAALEPTEQVEVKTVLLATGAANAVYTAEDEVFADAYAAEIISDLTGDPAVEPESGLHGEAVSEDGYAPVTNPEADAAARALAYYSPAEQRARAAPWPGLGTLWGKPKVDA